MQETLVNKGLNKGFFCTYDILKDHSDFKTLVTIYQSAWCNTPEEWNLCKPINPVN